MHVAFGELELSVFHDLLHNIVSHLPYEFSFGILRFWQNQLAVFQHSLCYLHDVLLGVCFCYHARQRVCYLYLLSELNGFQLIEECFIVLHAPHSELLNLRDTVSFIHDYFLWFVVAVEFYHFLYLHHLRELAWFHHYYVRYAEFIMPAFVPHYYYVHALHGFVPVYAERVYPAGWWNLIEFVLIKLLVYKVVWKHTGFLRDELGHHFPHVLVFAHIAFEFFVLFRVVRFKVYVAKVQFFVAWVETPAFEVGLPAGRRRLLNQLCFIACCYKRVDTLKLFVRYVVCFIEHDEVCTLRPHGQTVCVTCRDTPYG